MAGITGFSLNNSRLTISFMALVILVGVMQFLQFPRQEDPPIVIREAVVAAFFPGMVPDKMEDLITRRIEEQIRTMPEIDEITSESKTGVAVVHATTRDEFDNLEEIWQGIRNKMDDLRPELPDGTIGPFVNDEFGLVAIATIALWADGFSMAEMRLVARDIRDRLYELDGIRKVELYGVQDEQVTLKFSNAKLSQFGISPGEVVQTLVQQNIILPGGNLDAEGNDIIMSPSGNFTSVEDIEGMLIAVPGTQNMVRLDDLVTVERGYEDPPTSLAYFNGRETIVISVSITPGVNSVQFGEELTQKLRDEEAKLPIGYVLDYATFQPDLVVTAVNGALVNVYQTLAIVFVVVMLFLGVRTGLIVGSFVPMAMLLGLIVMSMVGVELERVSIVSSIVALGMLVDNAIVVAEDIRSRLERGQERRQACMDAGRTLAVPLLTSSLTTILAFTPMLLVDGQTGEYAFSLPMVVIILLLGSWFLSMFMTPAMAMWFMKVKVHAAGDNGDAEDAYDSGFYKKYRGFLEIALRGRILVAGVTIGLLVVAGLASSQLVREFFGPSDRNQFLIYIDLPAGSRVTATDRTVEEFTDWLSDKTINPEITSSIAYVGTGGPRFFLSLSPVDPDPHVAFVIVNTESHQQVPDLVKRIRAHLVDNFPNVSARVKRMWLGANEPALVEFRLVGEDSDFLYEKAWEVMGVLWDLPGIDYVENDWFNKIPRINVVVDQTRARRAGVTSEEVAVSLNAFLDGAPLTDYREGDLAIPVVLQAIDEERQTVGDLWNINVYSAQRDTNVPLTQIADFRAKWQFSRIARKDQERTVTIATRHQFLKAPELVAAMVEPEKTPGSEKSIFEEIWSKFKEIWSKLARIFVGATTDPEEDPGSEMSRFEEIGLKTIERRDGTIWRFIEDADSKPKAGHRWEIGGEIEDAAETNEKLFRNMPACLVGIVLLLIWQFNSFRRPLIIVLTIPMAFAGALAGLLIMRAPFDFFGILGLLSLAGVIINNGIVLIDRIDSERELGKEAYHAIIAAALARFRPILMSAITTILGVAPLILFRDPLFFSMAVVIAFGLAFGTVLTLVVVPVIYSFFFNARYPGAAEPEPAVLEPAAAQ